MNGAAIALSLLTIASTSAPGWYFNFALCVFAGWIILGLCWFVRQVGSWTVMVRHGTPPTAEPTLARWATAPLIAGLSILVGYSGLPETAALWLSRPAMDRLAAERLRTGAALPTRAWVGLFPAESIQVVPGGVRFLIRGTGVLGREGYAYYENGMFRGEQYWRQNEEPISGFWFKYSDPVKVFPG